MNAKDICEINCINEKAVKSVERQMVSGDAAIKLATTFAMLSDPTRLKMIYALSKKELCVCDLATVLNLTQSATSHQLRVLRMAQLVKFRKQGKIAYYSLQDDHVVKLIEAASKHANE